MNTLRFLLDDNEAAARLRGFLDGGGDVTCVGGGPGFEVKAISMYEAVRDRINLNKGISGSRAIVDLYARHWKSISRSVCGDVFVQQGDVREEGLGGGKRLWIINFVLAENWRDLINESR